ncbi:hypothetical protein ABVN80_21340 [Acinetobacter baumannii]
MNGLIASLSYICSGCDTYLPTASQTFTSIEDLS